MTVLSELLGALTPLPPLPVIPRCHPFHGYPAGEGENGLLGYWHY